MDDSSFHSTLGLPVASAGDAARAWQDFLASLLPEQKTLAAELSQQTEIKGLAIGACFFHSPYLSRLAARYPEIVHAACTEKGNVCWQELIAQLHDLQPNEEAETMRALRVAKSQAALLIGLCDLMGIWGLERVTACLSELADTSLNTACRFLMRQAARKMEIRLAAQDNCLAGSGLIVLGMGKLGANELNYSSDIDLIILFDKDRCQYTGRHNPQHFFSRLALDLVRLMQERTAQGYVFRTDLRLRPDPASTPPANSVGAAYTYYETVGQNWERAALIKARPVAGDIVAGETFLREIRSFIWRKHLDFAAIADIQSIRRQMNARDISGRGFADFNIKLGAGGIREIEFFTQIHQLIWGGRKPELRLRSTCAALTELADAGLIQKSTADSLIAHYRFYRNIEHRLQMREDEQTHALPKQEGLEKFSAFCGDISGDFYRILEGKTRWVHALYVSSFQGQKELTEQGNLVFTGADHDVPTLETIRLLGYQEPERISDTIRAWHHGQRRATRTKRARELITELTPALLKAFSTTTFPDEAFRRFDQLIAGVPAGIQLFSLFQMNSALLSLMAQLLGNAPAQAELLTKQPFLLDALLSPEFHSPLFSHQQLETQLRDMLGIAHDFEDAFTILVRFRQEKSFQSGVQFLRGGPSLEEYQQFLTALAEIILQKSVDLVVREFKRTYGTLPGSYFGILGLGRFGAREVAHDSDLDIVFLYDVEDASQTSDGERPFTAPVYFNRLAQRIITTLTALTAQGTLYALDTRLRPSGKDGPLAVNYDAFDLYFQDTAWTFERMALCKARPVYGDDSLKQKVTKSIANHLSRGLEDAPLRTDIIQLRQKVRNEFGQHAPWDVKHTEGGLMDLDFFAEYLLLSHPENRQLQAQASRTIFDCALTAQLLDETTHRVLQEAIQLQNRFLNFVRLSYGEHMQAANFRELITDAAAQHLGFADIPELETALLDLQHQVSVIFLHSLTSQESP